MNAFTGTTILVILGAMAGGWLFRTLLIRALRSRHPGKYAELGSPTTRQLSSLFPRFREMQIRFWRFLWGGNAFLLRDGLVSALAWGALASDVVMVIGIIVLFGHAAMPGP
jgi:hypothetical protein